MEALEFYKHLTELYGDDVEQRVAKLKEEVLELEEASKKSLTFGDFEHFIEELADVTVVLHHIIHISGYDVEELREIAEDKILKREIDPNYMR